MAVWRLCLQIYLALSLGLPTSTLAQTNLSTALVPVGPAVFNSGSGRSEVSSSYYEILPEFKKQKKLIAGDKDLTAKWKNHLNSFLAGHPSSTLLAQTNRVSKHTLEFGGLFATFGIAMGVIAASHLASNYPDNPRAWQQFTESLTDPIGMVAFVGFAVAAAPFFKRMSQTQKSLPRFGLFLGGMAAGVIVSQFISQVGNNPKFIQSVTQCLGFAEYGKTQTFLRNENACTAAAEQWTNSRELVSQFAPVIGQVLVASGAFYGLTSAAKLLLTQQNLLHFLSRMRIVVSLVGQSHFVFRVVSTVAMTTLFLGVYELSQHFVPIEVWFRNWLLMDINWGPSFYGNSIVSSRENLLRQIKQRLERKWQSSESFSKLCYDKNRKAEKFFDCENPNYTSFSSSLENDYLVRRKWREQQLASAQDVYNQWVKKTEAIYSMAEATYLFQKELWQSLVLQNVEPSFIDSKWEAEWRAKFALMTSLNNVSRPESIGYFKINDWFDYFFVTTICGSVVERSKLSWYQSESAKIIEGNRFRDLFFQPPAWVPRSAQVKTYCGTGAVSGFNLNPILPRTQAVSVVSQMPHSKVNWLNYLIDNLSTHLVIEDPESFEKWWQEVVSPHFRQLEKDLRLQYESFLTGTVLPSLNSKKWQRCEMLETSLTMQQWGFINQFHLPLDSNDLNCGKVNSLRVPVGVVFMLVEDLRFLLSVDSLLPYDRHRFSEDHELKSAEELLTLVDEISQSFSDIQSVNKAGTAQWNQWVSRFEQWKEKHSERLQALPSDDEIKAIASLVDRLILNMMGEFASHRASFSHLHYQSDRDE